MAARYPPHGHGCRRLGHSVTPDRAVRRRQFWLVLEPGDVSVCYTDPGFDIDAVLASDLATLYRMWEGEIELLDAVRAGAIRLTGARWIVRGLPNWLQLGPIAANVRAAVAATPS
jgi:hypothetical protein